MLCYFYPGKTPNPYMPEVSIISMKNNFCIACAGSKLIASGELREVAIATKKTMDSGNNSSILLFDDESQLVEIDFRGSMEEFKSKLEKTLTAITPKTNAVETKAEQQGPGRPKLGVVAREVTLMPRQWEWLGSQPGGASVTLRKLVEAARKANEGEDQKRRAREITYRFMSAMAGNEADFEEASRALFAKDKEKFDQLISPWGEDIKKHILMLSNASFHK